MISIFFILGFVGHVIPFKFLKMISNSSELNNITTLKEDLEGKKNLLQGYTAKIQKINDDTRVASSLGSNLKTTANLYASLNEIVPKDIRLTRFGIEEKNNVLFEGVAKNGQAVINMMENFSGNEVVSDSKMEAMVEFTKDDKIKLYTVQGQPTPTEEEIPNETITKKFNSRLSLKPITDEVFDDEAIVSNLLKAGKKW